MGRLKRERRERVRAGLEESIADKMRREREEAIRRVTGNPIGRQALKLASRKGVIAELSKGDTTELVGRLDSMVGTGDLSGGKLKAAIMSKAPKEMDKAIKKFQARGKEVTVDALCSEIRSTPEFLSMCERVGLSLEWFEDLAKQRMEAHGL